MQALKTTPHINQGKGATLIPGTLKLLHQRGSEKRQWGSRGCRLGLKSWLLMRKILKVSKGCD
jgi:hypothetical protein